MTELINHTLLSFRFTRDDYTILSLMAYTTVNTALRLLVVYMVIRSVMTAVAHGSF